MRLQLLCLVILSSILVRNSASGQPSLSRSDNDVYIHSLSDPEDLNPLTSFDADAAEINALMYESLTTTDWQTLKTIPMLAESLPVMSSDGMSYDVQLRRDAKFSDGHPVTADDFIFYLKTLKNPYIVNASPLRGYYARVDAAMRIDGDPYRLRVYMSDPYYLGDGWVGGLLALPKHIWDPHNLTDRMSFPELNGHEPSRNPVIKRFADWFQDTQKGRSKEFLIGSGPYMFDEWQRNDHVTLARNENYWHKDDPVYGRQYPGRIIWRTSNFIDTALASLMRGETMFIPNIEKSIYVEAKPHLAELGMKFAEYDYPAYTYIGYNQTRPMFKDKLVRQAFAYALDRETIIRTIYFGYAAPVQSPIPSVRPEYDNSLPLIPYDPEHSQQLLAQAGWKDSDGDGILDKTTNSTNIPFRFTIITNSGNWRRQQIAETFANELQKLGIEVTVRILDWALFLKETRDGNYDAYIGGWATSPIEGDMYQIWHSKSAERGGSNYVNFKNKRVDQLIEQIREEFDFEKRIPLYREIQQIIYDEQPYNFLVTEKQTGAYSNRLQNVEFYAPRPCYNPAWWIIAGRSNE